MQVGDVDFGKNFVVIRRQVFLGKGGLVTKPTKSRKDRQVPILEPLRPVLERLTKGKEPEDQLLVGPKGGYLTTATVRDATNWDSIVAGLGLPDLTRHGLRHTGATWMADAGIPPLHALQDILGHALMETTRGCLPRRPAPRLGSRAGQAQRPLGQGPVMRASSGGGTCAVVLVPFWSPYPQGSGTRRSDRPQATVRRDTRGTRGGTTENRSRT